MIIQIYLKEKFYCIHAKVSKFGHGTTFNEKVTPVNNWPRGNIL